MTSSPVTPAHIAGLVVGEGCFYAESAPDSGYRLGWRIRPAFCIEMRSDDREALEAVQAHLGCGSIYDLDFGRYRGYEAKDWHPHVKFRVGNMVDLHDRVVPFFETNVLFGRKAIAFQLFARLVRLVKAKAHLDQHRLAEARVVADALADHHRRGRRQAAASMGEGRS